MVTSLLLSLGLLILLLLLWLLLAELGDVDLLLALHHRLGHELKHVVQMEVDLGWGGEHRPPRVILS